jgi:hypothetical protein
MPRILWECLSQAFKIVSEFGRLERHNLLVHNFCGFQVRGVILIDPFRFLTETDEGP